MRIELNTLPVDVVRALRAMEKKENRQRHNDAMFCIVSGYVEGAIEQSTRNVHYSNPVADVAELDCLSEPLEYALNCLSSVQRRRICLFASGLTVHEIAQQEGVSVPAIRRSIKIARKKITKIL